MSRYRNKGEAECQTILQCSPHIIKEGEDVDVKSNESTQTIITWNPKNSNTNLCPLLQYCDPKDITKEAVKFLPYIRTRHKLQFNLPDDSAASSEDRDSDDDEDEDSDLIVEDIRKSKKLSILKRPTLDVTHSENKTNVQCQTVIMVYPHFLKGYQHAHVHSDISVQTSVTCHPQCSVTDIVPKLKAYLDHKGTVIYSGDTKNNNSILDLIKGIIEDVEISHKHMFDENYKLPTLPPELNNINNKTPDQLDPIPIPETGNLEDEQVSEQDDIGSKTPNKLDPIPIPETGNLEDEQASEQDDIGSKTSDKIDPAIISDKQSAELDISSKTSDGMNSILISETSIIEDKEVLERDDINSRISDKTDSSLVSETEEVEDKQVLDIVDINSQIFDKTEFSLVLETEEAEDRSSPELDDISNNVLIPQKDEPGHYNRRSETIPELIEHLNHPSMTFNTVPNNGNVDRPGDPDMAESFDVIELPQPGLIAEANKDVHLDKTVTFLDSDSKTSQQIDSSSVVDEDVIEILDETYFPAEDSAFEILSKEQIPTDDETEKSIDLQQTNNISETFTFLDKEPSDGNVTEPRQPDVIEESFIDLTDDIDSGMKIDLKSTSVLSEIERELSNLITADENSPSSLKIAESERSGREDISLEQYSQASRKLEADKEDLSDTQRQIYSTNPPASESVLRHSIVCISDKQTLEKESQVEGKTQKECVCSGLKIKLLINNIGGTLDGNINDQATNTGLELNILPGLQKIKVEPLTDQSGKDNLPVRPCDVPCKNDQTYINNQSKLANSKKSTCAAILSRMTPSEQLLNVDAIERNTTAPTLVEPLSRLAQRSLERLNQRTLDPEKIIPNVMSICNLPDSDIQTIVSKNADGFKVIVNINQPKTVSNQSENVGVNNMKSEIDAATSSPYLQHEPYFKSPVHPCKCDPKVPTTICRCGEWHPNNLPVKIFESVSNTENIPVTSENFAKIVAQNYSDDEYETCSEGPDTARSKFNDNVTIIQMDKQKIDTQLQFADNTVVNLRVMLDLKNFDHPCVCGNNVHKSANKSFSRRIMPSTSVLPSYANSYVSGILPHRVPKIFNVLNYDANEEQMLSTYSFGANSYLPTTSDQTVHILAPQSQSNFSFISTRLPIFVDNATSHNKIQNKQEKAPFVSNISFASERFPALSTPSNPDKLVKKVVKTGISFRNTIELDDFDMPTQYLKYSHEKVNRESHFSVPPLKPTKSRSLPAICNNCGKAVPKQRKQMPVEDNACTLNTCEHFNQPTINQPTINTNQNTCFSQGTSMYDSKTVTTVNITTSCDTIKSPPNQTCPKVYVSQNSKNAVTINAPQACCSTKPIQNYEPNLEKSIYLNPSQDRVITAVQTCEQQLKPIKMALSAIHQKLRCLNIPEIDSMFENNETFSNLPVIKSRVRLGATTKAPTDVPFTMKTRCKFNNSNRKSENSLNLSKPQHSPSTTNNYLDSAYHSPSGSSALNYGSNKSVTCFQKTPCCSSHKNNNYPSQPQKTKVSFDTSNIRDKSTQSKNKTMRTKLRIKPKTCDYVHSQVPPYFDNDDVVSISSQSDALSHVSSEEFICPCSHPSPSKGKIKSKKERKRKHDSSRTSCTSSEVSVCPFLEVMKSILLVGKKPNQKERTPNFDVKTCDKLHLHMNLK